MFYAIFRARVLRRVQNFLQFFSHLLWQKSFGRKNIREDKQIIKNLRIDIERDHKQCLLHFLNDDVANVVLEYCCIKYYDVVKTPVQQFCSRRVISDFDPPIYSELDCTCETPRACHKRRAHRTMCNVRTYGIYVVFADDDNQIQMWNAQNNLLMKLTNFEPGIGSPLHIFAVSVYKQNQLSCFVGIHNPNSVRASVCFVCGSHMKPMDIVGPSRFLWEDSVSRKNFVFAFYFYGYEYWRMCEDDGSWSLISTTTYDEDLKDNLLREYEYNYRSFCDFNENDIAMVINYHGQALTQVFLLDGLTGQRQFLFSCDKGFPHNAPSIQQHDIGSLVVWSRCYCYLWTAQTREVTILWNKIVPQESLQLLSPYFFVDCGKYCIYVREIRTGKQYRKDFLPFLQLSDVQLLQDNRLFIAYRNHWEIVNLSDDWTVLCKASFTRCGVFTHLADERVVHATAHKLTLWT